MSIFDQDHRGSILDRVNHRPSIFDRDNHQSTYPVENRYSFTDFNELDFTWQIESTKEKSIRNLLQAQRRT